MKIDKLYTLSQFVDKLHSREIAPSYSCNYMPKTKLYNDLLKQPLKNQMFVNPEYKSLIIKNE